MSVNKVIAMSKRLFKKIALWSASLIVILIIRAYFTMDYAVNKILHLMAPTELSLAQKDLNNDARKVVPPTTPAPSKNQTSSPAATSSATPHTTDKVSSSNASKPVNLDEPTLNPTPTPLLTYAAEISPEKATQVENQISLKDKTEISLILLKKLSPSDISLFTKMASNGLSIDEKREAKKEILKKLSEDEYNQLIQIAAKLGLSEGKSYAQSLKEFPTK
jgi:hypothetical protein